MGAVTAAPRRLNADASGVAKWRTTEGARKDDDRESYTHIHGERRRRAAAVAIPRDDIVTFYYLPDRWESQRRRWSAFARSIFSLNNSPNIHLPLTQRNSLHACRRNPRTSTLGFSPASRSVLGILCTEARCSSSLVPSWPSQTTFTSDWCRYIIRLYIRLLRDVQNSDKLLGIYSIQGDIITKQLLKYSLNHNKNYFRYFVKKKLLKKSK